MPRSFRFSHLVAALLVAVLAFGCKKRPPEPTPESPVIPLSVEHTGPPVTEDEARVFGDLLTKAVAAGDRAAIDDLLRLKDMLDRSVSDLGLLPAERKDLLAGASTGVGDFSAQLVKLVQGGGSYTLLRVRTSGGRPHVIFRYIDAEGMSEYHDYTLARDPHGRVATEDIYEHIHGETIRQKWRRFTLGVLLELKNSGRSRGRLSPVLDRYASVFRELMKHMESEQFKDALGAFRRLPAELRKDKTLQLVAIQAAQGISDDEYLTEVNRFQKEYPDDPAADLVSIDFFVLKGEYDEALRNIDRLDAAVGGDPYLNVKRASALMEAGQFKEAVAAAEKAVADEPTLVAGYFMRATIAAKQKNYVDVKAWFQKLATDACESFDPAILVDSEPFIEFAKSPQFQELKKWLGARRNTPRVR